MPDLRTRYVGLTLETPLIVASSGLTETLEKMRLCQEHGAGAVVVKSYAEEKVMRISPTPRYRVLHQRLGDEKSFTFMSYEQASRFDIDRYAQEVADARAKLHIKVIPSILCVTDEGWVRAAQILEEAGADALELNTSCPHGSITFRGKAVEETIFHTVRLVRKAVSLPLVVKISSMLTSPIGVVKELEKIGIQGVTIFNRMTALDVDVYTEEIEMPGGYAGHGGPWAVQYPLRWISQIAPQVRIDIAASGGVSCWEDVVRYFLVGATVVQVCTALFFNGYAFLEELVQGLERHMEQKGYRRVEDFRGKVLGKILGTCEIDRRHRFDARIDPSPTAPCKFACPVGVPIQAFVHYVAERDFEKALEMIRSAGPFQSVCGRVCYHPCEDACTRGDMDEPVAIMALKRFVLEWGERNRPLRDVAPDVAPPTGKRVAVVGAGPAGLTAAHDLAKRGHKVVVYEALPVPGGMMAVGVPEYRLPRELVREEIAYIERMGVEIRTGVRVGKDVTLEELRREYDAVFLSTGAHRSLRLGIPGEEFEGVILALDFLKKVNLEENVQVGRRVGVIGGGNTALDSARVALRLGADEVYLIYRRTEKEMPAQDWEVAEAEEEGVRILYLTAPLEILEDGRVKAVRCLPHILGKPDEDGRRRPEPAPASAFELPLDTILVAVGQAPDPIPGLPLRPDGKVAADPLTGYIGVPGVFAGGDVASGPASVVEAMASGRRAAEAMDRYLRGEDIHVEPSPFKEVDKLKVLGRNWEREKRPRTSPPVLDPSERRRSFGEEEAVSEAQRCLACGCGVGCGVCQRVCIHFAVEQEHDHYRVTEKCEGCGMCVQRCPLGTIAMVPHIGS
ncbi:MAG TPA: FAD-binding protein [Candidatus Latescibacteria bacterium]|nr:FAD-binding protein [Candidatus Latescibacterota bacterium]